MQKVKYVFWQDGDFDLGYLEEFPNYVTRGESLEDLQEHLIDPYKDLASGDLDGVRHRAGG